MFLVLSPFHNRLSILGRPELGVTLTKLRLWNLTQYDRLVYLDADTLVLKNIDALFNVAAEFAAVSDVGWPDCFNSGVMVIRPNAATSQRLLEKVAEIGSFDGRETVSVLFLLFINLELTNSPLSIHSPLKIDNEINESQAETRVS